MKPLVKVMVGVSVCAALTACGRSAAEPPAVPPARPAASNPAAPAPRTVQPGAPGEASRVVAPSRATTMKHTAADTRFMQGMIGHHAQAIEMVALLKTRTGRDDMRLLGRRIEVSQADEINLMRQWLIDRTEAVPNEHVHHQHDAKLMPGMLTPEEMARLAAAKGVEFDKLFLELMIKHHDGALVMVAELMASPGAAQDSDIYGFAADVEADQSAEILRMRTLRGSMGR
jgi:uncharacterized protein (DUF305 family)